MAVLQPDAYAAIQQALKNRADIALNQPPSTMGTLAKAVGTGVGAYAGSQVADAQQKDLEKFKFNLEDQLQQNATKYKAQSEGKSLVTPQDVQKYYADNGLDPKMAPSIPNEGLWMSHKEIQDEMRHAHFRTQVQGVADQYSQSKDPADQRRANYLKIVSSVPDEKLDSVMDDIRKVMVPESDVSKNADRPIGKDKDNLGRTRFTYNDGTEKVISSAPKPLKAGEVAKSQANLEPAELDTFKKGMTEFTTKTVKDSKQAFTDLDKLEKTVKDNNPVSFFNNKIELTRLGGISAGRIAQGEIVQEAGARDFVSQMQQKIQTLEKGDWTPENRKLIMKYIGSLKKIEQEHVSNALNDAVSSTHGSMPAPERIDPEFIKKEFSKPVAQYLPPEKVRVIGPIDPKTGKPQTGTANKGAALPKGWQLAD